MRPFHEEKKLSMQVLEDSNSVRCYSGNCLQINKKKYVIVVTILIIPLLVAFNRLNLNINKIILSKEQQPQVDELLNNSATRCLGTYLIDLPKQFKASKANWFEYDYYQSIYISTDQQSLPLFKQMLARREQELKNTQPVDPIDGNFLKAIYPLSVSNSNEIQGVIFERMESEGIPDFARILESYHWQDEVTFKIEMDATNGSASRYDEDRKKYPEIYNNDVPEKIAQMRTLFKRMRVRDDFTIPEEPGFCFINGFMQGDDDKLKEIQFTYRYEDREDFYFRIKFTNYAGSESLFDIPDNFIIQGEGQKIYQGTRESNNLHLEEIIVKNNDFLDSNDNGLKKERYIFNLGINMEEPDNKNPNLEIRMYYIIPPDSRKAYSLDQLMVIWREITNSIRIRENSFANE
ncbi:T6SS immunity protein Tli4 family protein [uncultured Apibacter sp.]|uniref:T6SS immunity protein Tli4 family protein n=1 Tax=uncultured Apibacter sp. TaxID=1778616 RepID=UPI0025CF4A97|nr:T6SS immunity protein Tli4 family protein [uncultured Apibacter sp.]